MNKLVPPASPWNFEDRQLTLAFNWIKQMNTIEESVHSVKRNASLIIGQKQVIEFERVFMKPFKSGDFHLAGTPLISCAALDYFALAYEKP